MSELWRERVRRAKQVLLGGKRVRWRLVAALTVAMALAGATGAGAAVRACHTYSRSGPGWVTSARNMSCRAAVGVWDRGHGEQPVVLRKGGRIQVDGFQCVTYANHTPPGPSDADVPVRCTRGPRTFRFEYAV